MQPVIRFLNVSKRYSLGLTRTSLPAVISQQLRRLVRGEAAAGSRKFHWALRDVSFDLYKGQSLALIGPNGAGKSTILKLLAMITRPTSGSLEVNGTLSALIELGAGFHPDLTGRENIFLNGTLLGMPRKDIQKRFDEIVSFAELDEFIDTPVKRYSSGMTVRLGFAVASCIEPDILLVDEVLAVGDASFRQKCIERIHALLSNGTSLIFVSHDMGLVRGVCREAIHIEHGQIQQAGATGEVIDHYNSVLNSRRSRALDQAEAPEHVEGGIEVTCLEVLDSQGEPIAETYGDRPIEFRVRYVAYRSFGKANALIRIYRSDGLSVCIVRTYLDGFPLDIQKGAGVLSVEMDPLQLFAGQYYATVWFMNANDSAGLTYGASDWFEVKNRAAGRDVHEAVYEPVRRWNHQIEALTETEAEKVWPQVPSIK